MLSLLQFPAGSQPTGVLKWVRNQLHECVLSLLQLGSGQLLVDRHVTKCLPDTFQDQICNGFQHHIAVIVIATFANV